MAPMDAAGSGSERRQSRESYHDSAPAWPRELHQRRKHDQVFLNIIPSSKANIIHLASQRTLVQGSFDGDDHDYGEAVSGYD